MENMTEYGSYGEYKRELDQEMGRAAESFVRIGYLLKVARDTDILRESGYSTVTQFAQAEYRLRPDQVTRFIQINDRFSAGGYAPRLEERYAGQGYTKLVEMLQLPDGVNEELTPGYTREDIRDIRTEIEEEQKISDIEVLLEGREENTEEESLAGSLIRQLLHDYPTLYVELYPLLGSGKGRDPQEARWAFAPSGEAMYSVRLRGVGKFLISLKAEEAEAALINVRTQEKDRCPWEEILDECSRRMIPGMAPEESWEKEYGEKLERESSQEKEEVQKKEERKKVRNQAKEKAEKEKAKKARAELEKYRKGAEENEGTDKNTGRDMGQGRTEDGHSGGDLGEAGERYGDSAADNACIDGERERDDGAGGETIETGTPDQEEAGDPAGFSGGLQPSAGCPAVPDGTEGADTVRGADKTQDGLASPTIPDTGSGVGNPAAAGGIAPAQRTRKEHLDSLTEYGAALYLSQQYRYDELGSLNMESAEELERWLSAIVDVYGNRI